MQSMFFSKCGTERYDEVYFSLAACQNPDQTYQLTTFLLLIQTLCCRINPKQAAITKLDYLNERVLQEYPNDDDTNFYFEMHGKPMNLKTCNSLMWMEGSTVFVQYRNRGGCFMVSLTVLTMIMAALVGSFCTCGLSLFVIPFLLPFLFILPLFCL
jgi:hypothetical protein